MSYKKFAQELYAVANQLDALGKRGLADKVDGIAADIIATADVETVYETSGWRHPSSFEQVTEKSIRDHFNTHKGNATNPIDALARYLKEQKVEPWQMPKVKAAILSSPEFKAKIRELVGVGSASADRSMLDGSPAPSAVDVSPSAVKQMAKELTDDPEIAAVIHEALAPSKALRTTPPPLPKKMPRGFASVPALALSFLTAGAVMLGLKDDDKDERLKTELDALEAIVKKQDGKDPATVRKIAEYALGKIKIIKSKIGEPGYQISSDQMNTLSQVESQLQDAMR